LVVLVLLRAQLQTGLFIVAHDAMHGLLVPGRTRWNNTMGALALLLYAGLPFSACLRQHQRHHRAPGSAQDPDFPNDLQAGALAWYRQFLARYLSQTQMLLLLASWALVLAITSAVAEVPLAIAFWRVLLFVTLPLLLSSLQLFVFGTFLPHRCQRRPEQRAHPISLNLPPWLSLLACFHFGYHREHHDNPGLSWFELPAARSLHQSLAVTEPLR
jgi:beta-carotene ketolase (CrtW type)